jgi:hypothetical protein
MQIQFIPVRKTKSGFALAVTLIFLAICLAVFASIMYLVSSSATVTARNNLFTVSQAAAEGAAETAIAQMDRDFLYQSLNDVSVYMVAVTNLNQTGWPVQFQFSDINGVANQISVVIQPQSWKDQQTNLVQLNSSQFKNLYGYVADCTVTATATPINQNYQMAATVIEKLQMAGIPVFQFGVFYNMDMDLSNGKPMTMNGKTFVNGNIWMYPQNTMTFNDTVAATLLVTNHDNPSDQQNLTSYTVPTYNFTANGGKPLSLADAVSLPIAGANSNPTNVEAILNLPPTGLGAPNTAAYISSNQMYLYNVCDLIISNSISGTNNGTTCALGTNITIYYQDKDQPGGPLIQLTNNEVCTFIKTNNPGAGTLWTTNSPNVPSGSGYMRIGSLFPFVTNVTFYDFREGDTVQAVQIDILKLNAWLANPSTEGYCWNQVCGGASGTTGDKGHPIDSIYVYTSVPPISGSPGWLPAVRVINGQQMPSSKGLTIATPFPLYVLGNYNIQQAAGGPYSQLTTDTSHTYPAALMGDAVTILSTTWSDTATAYTRAGNSMSARNAGNTTVNAACLEGIVQSITVGGTKHYSGGLENFLRLMENWSGDTLCYNGSIVVMFPSIYATNFWIQPGTYYDVPTRLWGFDANFTSQAGQPPATPRVRAMIRGQWNAQ